MEIETEMSIYFGNDRVHPVEYKHPVELLVVSMDIYEFVSKMLKRGCRDSLCKLHCFYNIEPYQWWSDRCQI